MTALRPIFTDLLPELPHPRGSADMTEALRYCRSVTAGTGHVAPLLGNPKGLYGMRWKGKWDNLRGR
jgi:hypothetical protein